MMTDFISRIGSNSLDMVRTMGKATLMLFGALVGKPQPRKMFPLLVTQLYSVGVRSLAIIVVSGLFIGMVLSLQGYLVLSDFGAETSLADGGVVAASGTGAGGYRIAFCRAGRLCADGGDWPDEATEQLSSMEMMLLTRFAV